MSGGHPLGALARTLPAVTVILACSPSAELEPGIESAPEPPIFKASHQASDIESRLQAISAVDSRVVWVSGLEGTYALTLDGGETWQASRGAGSPDSATLQFRDVHAFDEHTAYLLSAGDGDDSRIYRTTDGGTSWELQFINLEPEGFLDCFDFWDRTRGIAYGDSVGGELFVLTTMDGSTWSRIPATALPPAGEGEGGFAASGTCVETGPEGRAWIATGAAGNARVLATDDFGATWTFVDSPTVRGAAAGLMSVLFHSGGEGVALGGDLEQPDAITLNVTFSDDGGASWTASGPMSFPGAVYGGAWGGAGSDSVLIAAGPGGLNVSTNSGRSWAALSDAAFWAVDFGDDDTFWAVGPEGRITRFDRVR
ncbi:MAG: hypothetical protein GY769_10005 [bacterium]|nr:hypothetical protein [bacterium]